MKTTRRIPKSREELLTFAGLALTGAQAIGGDIPLELNTALRIAADLNDYAGTPGAGTGSGKRHLFEVARATVNLTQAARRSAQANAHKFCATAVDYLKGYLGRRWNPQWGTVGFTGASLKLPRNPLPLLIGIREYFRTHATHENAAQSLTAAQADTLATALESASQAVLEKQQARTEASQAHTAALRKLTKRLTGLRTELDQLLSNDDPRWRRFGFSRPIDLHLAEEVEGLTLTAGLPGQVVVKWNASARAEDYRVSYSIQGSTADPLELPLVAALTVTLTGLTSGSTVIVKIAARNRVGDSLPVEAQMVVP